MVDTKLLRRDRIVTLDLLRGFFMIGVIVDHSPWAPSLWFLLSGGASLFVSPAEGFFVISGILVGYIYGPKILVSTRAAFKKVWKRAGLLYVLSVVFTLIFTLWAYLLPAANVPLPVWSKGPESYVLNVLTMRYSYGWTDFLSRYAVFMFVAPLILWLAAKGWWLLIGLSSIALWAVLGGVPLLMPFAAWQLLFVFGVLIGYHLPQLRSFWQKQVGRIQKKYILTSLLAITSSTYLFLMTTLLLFPYLNNQLGTNIGEDLTIAVRSLEPLFSKDILGPGRVLLGIVWFTTLYLVFRRYESKVQEITRGSIGLIGQNSLFVYGLHAFVLFTISTLVFPVYSDSLLFNTFFTGLILALIYFIAKYRQSIRKFFVKVKSD